MRVGELQHLLSQTNSKCPGCVEKGDYVRRCQQVWQELRRAPATVHVVSSEFDSDIQEGSEYEWLSGPYDLAEPQLELGCSRLATTPIRTPPLSGECTSSLRLLPCAGAWNCAGFGGRCVGGWPVQR